MRLRRCPVAVRRKPRRTTLHPGARRCSEVVVWEKREDAGGEADGRRAGVGHFGGITAAPSCAENLPQDLERADNRSAFVGRVFLPDINN